jgi:dTDP-4-dehydrorhamnose reductase
MKKLLITGAAGFLGWNLCRIGRESYEVTGIVHEKTTSIEDVSTVPCDLRDFSALKKTFTSINPDLVIHAAAASDPNFCQQHPRESEPINVDVPTALAKLCAQREIPYVFTSTDLVFDGSSPPYNELSVVNPLSVYAQQKVHAEIEILKNYKKAVICRMPLMFGDTPEGSKRFLQLWMEQLHTGKGLTLFTDEFRTPVSGSNASEGLLLAAEKAHGIIHLGGHERVSRYDFGLTIVELMDIPKGLIKPCKQSDVKMAAPRPKDVSLDSSKAFALGFNPGNIYSELQKLECLKH